MKTSNNNKRSISLVLIFMFINLILIHNIQSNNNKILSNKSNLTSNNSNSNNKKNLKIAIKKGIDVLGIENKNLKILKKFPYNITECSDAIEVKAEYIPDLTDYKLRKKGIYLINSHRISLFDEKKALIHSILWTETKKMAGFLLGAKGCIEIDGGSTTSEITMCFGTNIANASNIIENIKKFKRCRNGDNLVSLDDKALESLEKNCGDSSTESMLNSKINLSEARKDNKWDEDRVNHLQALNVQIPGTPRLPSVYDQ